MAVGDIHGAMFRMKVKNIFGSDNNSCYFLKIALPYIPSILMLIFNTSIETSAVPVSWKIARVTPIYKEGEMSEKSSYRPISVLPVLSRLFEKLTYDQLYQYLERGGGIPDIRKVWIQGFTFISHLFTEMHR